MSFRSARAAFTLIELLVVIAIIGVLVSMTMVVGGKIADGARTKKTKNTIQMLDSFLQTYTAEREEIPDELMATPRFENRPPRQQKLIPIVDGITHTGPGWIREINTVAYFMHQASEIGAIRASIENVDPEFMRLFNVDRAPLRARRSDRQPIDLDDEQPELPTMFDAWDNPIHYVHPKFDGILVRNDRRKLGTTGLQVRLFMGDIGLGYDKYDEQDFLIPKIRRNKLVAEDYANWAPISEKEKPAFGDSDGGVCPNDRPYFYSAGPDGDPSTTDDNVYTIIPRFQEPTFTGG